MNNVAIDKAFEVGLMECLRGIQKTNPNLLLTAQQLKKAERDARYVPAVAASIASIISKSTDSQFQKTMTHLIRQWGGGGGAAAETEEGDTVEDITAVDKAASQESGIDHPLSQNHDDDEDDRGELAAADALQPTHNSRQVQNLVRDLGSSIEMRLRQVLTTHEEATKESKRPRKAAKEDDGDDDEAEQGVNDTQKSHQKNSVTLNLDSDNDDNKSQGSESVESYNFSASSNDPPERASVATRSPGSRQDEFDEFEEVGDMLESPRRTSPSRITNESNNDDKVQDVFDDDDWWPEA